MSRELPSDEMERLRQRLFWRLRGEPNPTGLPPDDYDEEAALGAHRAEVEPPHYHGAERRSAV